MVEQEIGNFINYQIATVSDANSMWLLNFITIILSRKNRKNGAPVYLNTFAMGFSDSRTEFYIIIGVYVLGSEINSLIYIFSWVLKLQFQ